MRWNHAQTRQAPSTFEIESPRGSSVTTTGRKPPERNPTCNFLAS